MKAQTAAKAAFALGSAFAHATPNCSPSVVANFTQVFFGPEMLKCSTVWEQSGAMQELQIHTANLSPDQRMKVLAKVCASEECKPLFTRLDAFGISLTSDCEILGLSLMKSIDEIVTCNTTLSASNSNTTNTTDKATTPGKAAQSGAVHVTRNIQMVIVAVAGVTLAALFGL